MDAGSPGAVGILIRRLFYGPTAARTRWRVIALAPPPLLVHAPETRLCWRLDLVRCLGGAPASWIVEACSRPVSLPLTSLAISAQRLR